MKQKPHIKRWTYLLWGVFRTRASPKPIGLTRRFEDLARMKLWRLK